MDHALPNHDMYEIDGGGVFEEEEDELPEPEFSLGRDNRTRWYTSRPANSKSKFQSVHYPGVQSVAENLTEPYECWRLFFNDILDSIVTYTNTYIELSQEESGLGKGEEAICKRPTNVTEIEAFIGLLYLCGIYKSDSMNTSDLWKKDGTGVELFSYTMHHNRFQFLLEAIQFDDVRTRDERKESDKLAPVRDLLDLFIDNCQKNYCVSDLVFIKERYEPFRGKCSFKQYLPNSNKHYGLRMHTAMDAVMFYTFNVEIDVPNQVTGVYKLDTGFNNLVLRLCEPILSDGRCVIVEKPANFKLAKKLLSKRTYLVGKLDPGELEIPEHFVNVTSHCSLRAAYTEDATLVSIPKKSHASVLLSTRPDEVAEDLGQFVTVVSRMVKVVHDNDACVRFISKDNNRWPMIVFYSLLNIASQNSLIISRCNGKEIESRKEFVRELAMKLVHNHLVGNMDNPALAFIVKTRISKITRQEIPIQSLQFQCEEGSLAYRCHECPTRRKKKTKNVCKDCKKPLCLEHLVKICEGCYLRGIGQQVKLDETVMF